MKKIGIMTMQRIKNYGSFLQAYGLKTIIESLGYDVTFVDYEYEQQIVESKKKHSIIKILTKLNLYNTIRRKKVLNDYLNKFSSEYIPYLCDKKNNTRPNDIDLLVIGSDEVFNCLQEYPVGYSRELFGKNYEHIPVISYAASFGQTDINELQKYGIDYEISSYLNNFKAISVRDSNSYNTVLKLTNTKPVINLDPVLVCDYKDLKKVEVNIEDYIIIYAYPDRLSKKEQKLIKQFAKRKNKKILSFGMYQEISDIEIIVDPLSIFSYFEKADFIITDTFHGSIFSIKTHKNFCTIIRKGNSGNSNKLFDLLSRLKLDNRIIEDLEKLDDFYNHDIDYSITNKIISTEKEKTIDYLKGNLE